MKDILRQRRSTMYSLRPSRLSAIAVNLYTPAYEKQSGKVTPKSSHYPKIGVAKTKDNLPQWRRGAMDAM